MMRRAHAHTLGCWIATGAAPLALASSDDEPVDAVHAPPVMVVPA